MVLSEVIEIIIGLIFIYLILSLLGTTINELIFGLLHMRGKNLKKSLEYMLKDVDEEKFFKNFLEHPKFVKLRLNTNNKYPSYMQSSTFSKMIIESLSEERDKEKIEEALADLKGNTGKIFRSYWKEVGEDIEEFKKKLEDWFDEVQQRAIGWYKRNIQRTLIIIGLIIAVSVNADTFKMIKKLATDSRARKSLVELSIKQVQEMEEQNFPSSEPFLESDYTEVDGELEYEPKDFQTYSFDDIKELNKQAQDILTDQYSEIDRIMGMGFNTYEMDLKEAKSNNTVVWSIIKKLIGLLCTAIAISLGANFWFEILQKAIRISGVKIESKTENKKEPKPIKK